MGFEYDQAPRQDYSEGYLTSYPSSFDPNAPSYQEPGKGPEAPPVDIGEYGVRSGHEYEGGLAPQEPRAPAYTAQDAYPLHEPGYDRLEGYERGYADHPQQQGYQQQGFPQVEVGYAAQQAAPVAYPRPAEHGYWQQPSYTGAPAEAWQRGYQGAYAPQPRETAFDWLRAVYTCATMAALATLVSIGLELILSFIGYGLAAQGHLTGGMLVILFSFIIPVAVAGFGSGYRLESYGWLVGMISVFFWAFVFRPMYYAVFSWMLTERFSLSALFNTYSLVFMFGLFLPLGALFGWLGEKRATTGLSF